LKYEEVKENIIGAGLIFISVSAIAGPSRPGI